MSLEVVGRSFADVHNAAGSVVSLNGSCSVDVATNSIRVKEAGVVDALVSQNPNVYKRGKLMYDGMTGVLSASRPLETLMYLGSFPHRATNVPLSLS